MSDTSHFDFGKFVPGFDFLQSLTKGASSSIPQIPSLSNWVAPTISVEELEKRIDELKAVQFWLDQNSRALTATVQALEVQKMTLATLKGMNFNMGDVANAFKLKTADTVMSSVQKAADAMTGAAGAMASAATRATGGARGADAAHKPAEPEAPPSQPTTPPAPEAAAPTPAAPAVVDPMQWWGALTSQFQEIATNAMKDAARQTAIDTSKNLAAEALKTATDMASQFAATSMQTLQAGSKRAAPPGKAAQKTADTTTTPAPAKPRARKTTSQPVAKSAIKPAAKKVTTARKRAG